MIDRAHGIWHIYGTVDEVIVIHWVGLNILEVINIKVVILVHPQIEILPDFVCKNGVKDTSLRTRDQLKSLVSRLGAVTGVENRANALSNSGIIESYLNNFKEALRCFERSLSIRFSDVVYSNYLRALEKTGNYGLVLDEAIKFLDKNPNNECVFTTALDVMHKYYLYDKMQTLFAFNKNMKNKEKHSEFICAYQDTYKKLMKIGVDCEYLNLLINIAYIEIECLQVGNIGINLHVNDINQFVILFVIHGIGFEEVKSLNKNFDNSVATLLDSGDISPDLYFDHLTKAVLGFKFASIEVDSLT